MGAVQPFCEHLKIFEEKCRGASLRLERVAVESPASIANLGPGFDIFGLALRHPRDALTLEAKEGSGSIELETRGEEIPGGNEKNIAFLLIRELLRACGMERKIDLHITLEKGVPISRGLGSSAASSVAAVGAFSHLFGLPLSERESILISACGEMMVAGSLHYDNVSASYLGGVVLTDYETLKFIKLPIPANAFFTVIVPTGLGKVEGKTRAARGILPKDISLESSIRQSSAVGKLTASLFLKDLKMFGESVSTDHIAEPHRKKLIPYYDLLKKEAFSHGALGFNISGAGPSVFAVSPNEKVANNVGKALTELLEEKGISSMYIVSEASEEGIKRRE
ncbi:MAG: homoserine kinase [Fervidicoccaceae archaeon]